MFGSEGFRAEGRELDWEGRSWQVVVLRVPYEEGWLLGLRSLVKCLAWVIQGQYV